MVGHSDLPEVSHVHKVLTSLSAGALAGALAKTTIAPLDRCKISFQVSNQHFSYHAAVRFLMDTYKKEGVTALWRGNSATMMRVIPFAAIQFCAHEQWKHLFNVDQAQHTPLRRVLAGSLAGVTATSCTYPLDLARARLAVYDKTKYKTLRSVFIKIYRLEGPRAFYKGFSPTILGVVPYAGASFFTYESCKLYYQESVGRNVTTVERMVFGAFAGLVGQSFSYPLDIVRRRMQTSTSLHPMAGIIFIMRSVVAHEGVVRGLYKGLSLNWIKGPIAVSISFTTFDTMVRFLRRLTFFQDGR